MMMFWAILGAVAVLALLMDLGSLGAGALGMTGQFNASSPDSRDYGAETDRTLNTQVDQLGTRLSAQQQYQPQFGQAGMSSLAQILLGQSGGQQAAANGGLMGVLAALEPMLRQTQSADRSSDINDAATLTRQLNPAGANLIDSTSAQAQSALDNGMSPGMMRDVQQSIRGGQAARGVGYGPSDQFDEVFGTGMAANQLQQQNQANALNAAGASQNFYGNPFALIMRGGGPGMSAASGGLSLADVLNQQSGPSLTNPENQYANSVYGGNYQGSLQTNLLNAQLMAQYVAMNAKGGDSLSGAALGGMGGGALGGFSGSGMSAGGFSGGGAAGGWGSAGAGMYA